MAERRMFSKRVVGSARFLKMPISTQCLYFHLGLNADDDGIVEAYTIIKQIGATEDDLKVLVAKGFCKVLNEDVQVASHGPHRLGEVGIGEDRLGKDNTHTTGGKLECGKLNNVYLTQEQLDELYRLIPSQADRYIEKFGRYKAIKNIESHDDYAWICGWMDEDEAIVKERRKQEAERWDAIVEEEANEQP